MSRATSLAAKAPPRRWAWGALALLAAAPALAAGDHLEAGLRQCASETDEHQRLACYDALAQALPRIKVDQFGMTGAIERKRDPVVAAEAARERVQESLSGSIAGIGRGPRGERVFTLDNGQQWIEVEPRPALEFSAGEAVTIGHGALGTLWLKADGRRQVKVRRIQ